MSSNLPSDRSAEEVRGEMAIGEQRNLEDTAARLVRWFARQLPAARLISVHDLTAPGMGFSNETLLCTLRWTGDNGEHVEPLVIRIKPERQIFPDYNLDLQCKVMRRLAGTDVPVPVIRWEEKDRTVLGSEFYVMDRIDGFVPPDHPTYHAAGPVTELSNESRAAIWWDGLEVMARLHCLDPASVGLADLKSAAGRTPLEHQLDFYERFLNWANDGKPHPTATPALEWLRRHQPRDEPAAICWGDARIGNMIFRDDRCVAVLDWEMVCLGNPEMDLAWWLFFDWHHSEGVGVPRLAGFPSREETITRYEQLVGRPVRSLGFYEIFAAFRFAVIMIRVARLAREAGLYTPPDLDTDNVCTRRLAQLLA